MDSFTAGIALIVSQFCIALVMTGVYFAVPREKCIRYWAISEILLCIGVLIIVRNAGGQSYALLFIGTNIAVWGTIFQFWGLEAFYRKKPSVLGWIVGISFLLLVTASIVMNSSFVDRLVLLTAALLVVGSLNWRVIWVGSRSGRTFGTILTLGAAGILIVNNALRIFEIFLQVQNFQPNTHTIAGVTSLYLVPLGGSLMYATGLLLLYFERIVAEKHHLATHDELTGMLNRRAIVSAGDREVAMALRTKQPLSIAFVDIDFFKRVNDNLGHEAGDVLLVEVAQLLKATCRNIDLVGRYGGEEFCVIFPGVAHENVRIVGERLLNAVRQYRFHNQYQMTVSIGFASLPGNATNRSWTDLINRADAALYKAKDFGRDQFIISDDGLA